MGLPARCTRSSPTTSPQGPPWSPTDGPVTWASTRSATRMIGAVNAPPRPWARTSASCCRECTASRPWPNGGCFPPTKARCTSSTCLVTWTSSASGSTVAAHAAAVWSSTGCSNWPSATTQSVTSSSLRAPSRRRSGRPLPETEATRLAWTAPAPDDPGATRPDEAKSAQMDSPVDCNGLDPIRHEHGDCDDQMQTPVAVRLRRGDVVLDLEHGDVLLAGEHVADPIRVGDEAAGDPDAGDVLDVIADLVQRERTARAQCLLQDALGRLQPGLDVFDGVVVVDRAEIFLQDVDLRHHLVRRELVQHHEPCEFGPQLPQSTALIGTQFGHGYSLCALADTRGLPSLPPAVGCPLHDAQKLIFEIHRTG